MKRAVILMNRSAHWWQWVRHFGDFVTIPLAILTFAGLAGLSRLYLVVVGLLAWTLVEYLMHRFVFHHFPLARHLHQLHHDHPADPDSERSSLSTPLVVAPFALLSLGIAGVEDGSAILAGLLAGYLIFIAVHHAVHRWPVNPRSPLYSIKLRHLVHHHLEDCNFGVTTGFWDVICRSSAGAVAKRRLRSRRSLAGRRRRPRTSYEPAGSHRQGEERTAPPAC
ncbi:MAG TPA: sterol desaturase family protein [Bradyrhizobium sp.]|uniref:sterol desaturase family protein n=1 Tax=Bradyrhizobium sp. TaxID=376 RepID=UPI002BCF5C6A|nr:sterol desaturase family protein [Bradyrhizobium sp.]HLZ00558.1 sterol desaturase family protein [Bradyrhizobium sp.]